MTKAGAKVMKMDGHQTTVMARIGIPVGPLDYVAKAVTLVPLDLHRIDLTPVGKGLAVLHGGHVMPTAELKNFLDKRHACAVG